MSSKSKFAEYEKDKVLHPDRINAQVLQARYEVRGKVVIQATAFQAAIKAAKAAGKPSPFPFDDVIFCNIGNPQQLKQKPITFVRQVTALMEYPQLMELAPQAFAPDAISRAKRLLDAGSGTGPYTHSQGLLAIRKDIAEFVAERDGHPADPDAIFLTDGASTGVKMLLNTLIRNPKSGIMIPIPQYPLYSASLTLYGGTAVNYYLNEEQNWGLSITELERAYKQAADSGIDVRALVVINPSNPTGQALSTENMTEVIRFCERHNVVLMADEVYQDNLYEPGAKFVSFRKLVLDMGPPTSLKIELASFHSVSKGFLGECGKRGGYFMLDGVLPSVVQELYKLASICLCPNTIGQVITDIMVMPPKKGDPSYEQFVHEKAAILESLKHRAIQLSDALNSCDGFHCTKPTASMYLFPTITLPPKAIKAAQDAGEVPDMFFCLELLKATGICVVPGSGFGQKDGSWHFRTTFLPPEDQIATVAERIKVFNSEFMRRYS